MTPLPSFIFILLLFSRGLFSDAQPHVCIIGSGISAASASHFLNIHASGPKITVFEKSNRSGGRIATLCPTNSPCIEAGASIIAADNSLMAYFVDFLNLTRVNDTGHFETLGFWNGTSFVFRSQPSRFRTMLALLLRYRFSLFRMKLFVRRFLKAFSKLYPEGGPGAVWEPYKTVEELLARAPLLYESTQRRFADIIRDKFSPRFIDEMVAAITRVNYGQDVEDMNGMAGSVGLAGSGSGLWSVAGGNEQVVSGLLKHENVDLQFGTRVTEVDRRDGGYEITSEKSRWFCDAVIMAIPAEVARIKFPKEISNKLDANRSFQKTVATFVRGALNEDTFGTNSPDVILTTSKVEDVFTSVARKNVQGDVNIFKVFSKESLNSEALMRLFHPGAEVLAEYPWLAYPKYAVPERFASFDVDRDGAFIYTSPLESAGSAMEMSALAGANAAALICDKLGLQLTEEAPAVKEDL